jgi:predicted dehydrogenase
MGRTHSNAYSQLSPFLRHRTRPSPPGGLRPRRGQGQSLRRKWGYASYETDWRELVAREDIDAIDICTPNDSHAEIALACIEQRQDDPLRKTPRPQRRAGRGDGRRRGEIRPAEPRLVQLPLPPAVTLAKNIVDAGELGRVFHYRANFLQDWTISEELPQGGAGLWRLDAAAAGSGVTGDLLAHCIDTARWINGDIVSVSAMTETFIKERVHTATGEKQAVTIDDACAFLARFENGSLAIFESTRYARGHKALYTFEINGEKKSLAWDLHDLNRLSYFDHGVPGDRRGWSSIHCSDGDHPYAGNWWVPGLCLGYEHSFIHELAEFFKSLDDPGQGKRYPDFRHALGTQYVCDAVLESARTKQWVDVKADFRAPARSG